MIGDIRLSRRHDAVLDGIVASGSLVLRKAGGCSRAGELAAHRFLMNERVLPELIFAEAQQRCIAACEGRRVVVVQDTTEVNFAGRSAARRGLGPGGDGKSPGFFIHPAIAVDLASEAVVGLVSGHIWTRSGKVAAHRRQRKFEDKESVRWLDMADLASRCLGSAERVTVVCDREGDIYPLFARYPRTIDLVVRCAHNRQQSGEHPPVFEAELVGLGEMKVNVPAQPGRKARTADVELRAGRVKLARPANGVDKQDPDWLEMTLLEVVERSGADDVDKPLHWRLYTNMPVEDEAAAREIVKIYRMRWRIEETFRTLKSAGLKLEDSQVHEAGALMNLAALGLVAAVRIIQLVDARDGSERPATDVLDAPLHGAVQSISDSLEGKTDRQKNPHSPGSLPWLSWVCGRLGGWNCYYGKPGPKTMADGWERLSHMLEGYMIANRKSDV